MAQDIFLQSHSTVSDRTATFEDDERVAWLYLSAPGNGHIEKDAIVYMRVAPIDRAAFEALRRAKARPLLKEIASGEAVVPDPEKREFSFRWSRDGQAVAILRNGVALAYVTAGEWFGYSKAVSASSPFAYAWDQTRYDALFAQ